MTNVHPFPAGGKSAKTLRKKNRRTVSQPATPVPALRLQDVEGQPVDVLAKILHAGELFLSPADVAQAEDVGDLPSAQFLLTVHGMNTLTDAANVLIFEAGTHPESADQEAVDGLFERAQKMHKLVRKLDEILPQDSFILSSNSFGPEMLAEYATNAAMLAVSHFALDLLDYYDTKFIRTRQDTRKKLLREIQEGYQEVMHDGGLRAEAHGFLIKELSSAQRALLKVLKDL